MEPTRTELEAAACWFDSDSVAGQPEMTAFKRRARFHQSQWREARGYARGSHRAGVPNGSMLAEAEANRFANFLSPEVIRAVQDRVASPQKGQQFDQHRLKGNLLSSMPMCFNLFGELSADRDRQTAAGQALFGLNSPGHEVLFEWSPGRTSGVYTGDRTAFDVALTFGSSEGPRDVIGIETKYHEHITAEASPDTEKRLPRYLEIAERSGIFRAGWQSMVLGQDLQQIWRDHLLLLSMLQHPSGEWKQGKYVLVYPEQNASFREACARYADLLIDGSTFQPASLESLLDAHVLHGAEVEQLFRERYLW